MNIPHLFTRVRLCEQCLKNKKPYPSKEDLKHHRLRFVVKTNDPKYMFKIRNQTKGGQIGLTPHLFKVELLPFYSGNNQLYEVKSACSVEHCGCIFLISNEQKIQIQFEFSRREVLTYNQVMAIYNYKDEALMLDGKEEQFHITDEYLKDYFPN